MRLPHGALHRSNVARLNDFMRQRAKHRLPEKFHDPLFMLSANGIIKRRVDAQTGLVQAIRNKSNAIQRRSRQPAMQAKGRSYLVKCACRYPCAYHPAPG
jgi:hypothetical protein